MANLQRATLLSIAFAQGHGELLRAAMQDRIHQPYREEICPLLPLLLPLAGQKGILGVALSGAGPAVLLLIERDALQGRKNWLVRPPRESMDWNCWRAIWRGLVSLSSDHGTQNQQVRDQSVVAEGDCEFFPSPVTPRCRKASATLAFYQHLI